MAVGLIDWDLVRWKQPIPFNLELMKIARFQKTKKREIVKMLKTFNTDPYSKIILRKDFEDYDYPIDIFGNPKVTAGGLVFNNNIYTPMPLEVESMEPDVSIYSSMGKYYQTNAFSYSMWERMKHSIHLRLSFDGNTVWKQWEKQLGNINPKIKRSAIIYDQDPVRIWGSLYEIKRIAKSLHPQGQRIGFKYPLVVKTSVEFSDWVSIKKLRYLSTVKVYNTVSDHLLVNSLTSPQELIYVIGFDQYKPKEFISVYLPRYYCQMVYAANQNAKIKLEIEDGFLTQDWLNVIALINEFSEYSYKYRKSNLTLFSFDKKIAKTLLCDAVAGFKFVQENNYELFKEFYECLEPKYLNGYLTYTKN